MARPVKTEPLVETALKPKFLSANLLGRCSIKQPSAIRNWCKCSGGFCHPLFFSLQAQLVNSLGFAGSTVSVGTAPLCLGLGKAALDGTLNKWPGLRSKQFYLQKRGVSGLDWRAGCSLLSKAPSSSFLTLGGEVK